MTSKILNADVCSLSQFPFPNSKFIILVDEEEYESPAFQDDFGGDILLTLSPSLAVNPSQAAQDTDPPLPR